MAKIGDWILRVRGAVSLNDDGDADKIAALCSDAEDAGKNSSVWHNAAAYYGKSATCPCYPCSKARGGN